MVQAQNKPTIKHRHMNWLYFENIVKTQTQLERRSFVKVIAKKVYNFSYISIFVLILKELYQGGCNNDFNVVVFFEFANCRPRKMSKLLQVNFHFGCDKTNLEINICSGCFRFLDSNEITNASEISRNDFSGQSDALYDTLVKNAKPFKGLRNLAIM